MIMDESASIRMFFNSYYVLLSTEWLESCISWCKSEMLSPNYTIKDLQLLVFEQWLLLDLRDVVIPCLPPNLSQKQLFTLEGTYSLQLLEVVDISKPKLWQLQRIQNNLSKTGEQEVGNAKRTLLLTLTDGAQEIQCLEFKTIPIININQKPGSKVQLLGPIIIRRGQLMLESHNIKTLGGEVEDLLVPNAAENVLARALKLPVNPNPQTITANLENFETGNAMDTTPTIQNNVQNIQGILPQTSITRNATRIEDNLQSTEIEYKSNTSRTEIFDNYPQEMENINSNIMEDEDRLAAEIELLMEVERDFNENPSTNRKSVNKTPDMFEDLNDYHFENTKPIKSTFNDLTRTSTKNEQPRIVNDSESLDNDIFDNLDVDQLDNIEREAANQSDDQAKSIITVEELSRNLLGVTNRKYKIKVKFKSIVEKLTIADNEFYLVIKVEDHTGDITVKFHSAVVADLIKFSPLDLMHLKNGVMGNDIEAQTKVLQALKQLKHQLINLNNLLEIEVSKSEPHPVVTGLL